MNKWFRFCQPIGCALITVAFVETILNSFWLLLQYSGLQYPVFLLKDSITHDFWNSVLWNFLISLRFLLCIHFWFGVIFYGKKLQLALWLITSVMNDIGIVLFYFLRVHGQPYEFRGGEDSDISDIWGFGILPPTSKILAFVGFAIVRSYLYSVALQGVCSIHHKYDHSHARSFADDISDIDICVEPLGEGICQVWAFFKDFPAKTALVLLTTEVLWNLEHIVFRELFTIMLNKPGKSMLTLEVNQDVPYVFLEDDLMRVIRILIDIVGICFMHKEKLNYVRLWVIMYFLALLCTNAIFIMTVTVRDLHWTLFHSICFVFDNIFRFYILYFSTKFAIVHRGTIGK